MSLVTSFTCQSRSISYRTPPKQTQDAQKRAIELRTIENSIQFHKLFNQSSIELTCIKFAGQSPPALTFSLADF